MKTTKLPLSVRLRLALLQGIARLLAWAVAPALKPAPVHANRAERAAPHGGRVFDGEFRRVDEPNRW